MSDNNFENCMHTEHLSVNYGKTPILEDISLDFPARKVTAILGPSGCGKTTLLRCLNGTIHGMADASVLGSIALGQNDISRLKKEELCRKVGLVFQTPAPFPFSIYKNMTYALNYYGVRDKKRLEDAVREKLQVTGLWDEVKDDLGKSAMKLSGGQQQRLCIARALTVEPEVLLLDEPCSALDIQSTLQIERMLNECKKDYSIIMVTHNIAQAKRVADHIVFLFDHKVCEVKDAKEFFENPEKEETKAFLEGFYG